MTSAAEGEPDPANARERAVLLVAHPGHELRVFAWVERLQPRVLVLTDGSGHGDHGRVASTERVVAGCGASPGRLFGRLSDRAAYRLILDGDLAAAIALAGEVVAELVAAGTTLLASDAVEGFNPVHDLCGVIAEAAAARAGRRLGRPVRHLDFPLEAAPDSAAAGALRGDRRVELADDVWRRKLEAARAYPELRAEVARNFAAHGREAFRVERLRPVPPRRDWAELVGAPPHYERVGEERRREGVYERVLRFREHFLPLAAAIRAWAEGDGERPA